MLKAFGWINMMQKRQETRPQRPSTRIKQNDEALSGLSLEGWREAEEKRQKTRLPEWGKTQQMS
jgi:hypothetical protein